MLPDYVNPIQNLVSYLFKVPIYSLLRDHPEALQELKVSESGTF